jgi:NAD(P)-dependent dehydrogenase (short-subunit alcohol dehydrogenase family)
MALTEGLGIHLSPHGIIVNGIAPGRIATGMLGRDDQSNIYDDKQPLFRFGLPEKVAEFAVFLMSDAANYIVGKTIVCDGGYTLKG